jgi:putative toxin-antitoxin system antitoxin component (TIGR02293 family)
MSTSASPTPSLAGRLAESFEDWLGKKAPTEQAVVRIIEAGLPTGVIQHFLERGLTKPEVFTIVNERTLKHRRAKKQPLSREESERAVRTARILARAEAVFGEREAALQWLRASKKRFEGRTPMQMLATEPGGRMVEEMLIQADEGMFA